MTRCNGFERHQMVTVVRGLAICECSASGRLINFKGAEAEARRIVDRMGGFDAVRNRLNDEATERKRRAREEREKLLEGWHSAGTYSFPAA